MFSSPFLKNQMSPPVLCILRVNNLFLISVLWDTCVLNLILSREGLVPTAPGAAWARGWCTSLSGTHGGNSTSRCHCHSRSTRSLLCPSCRWADADLFLSPCTTPTLCLPTLGPQPVSQPYKREYFLLF